MALENGKKLAIDSRIEEIKKEKAYKNVNENVNDLNERLKVALTIGYDPLGKLSITQIVEDIKTVNSLKDINLD